MTAPDRASAVADAHRALRRVDGMRRAHGTRQGIVPLAMIKPARCTPTGLPQRAAYVQ
jgi:hypothetical protein